MQLLCIWLSGFNEFLTLNYFAQRQQFSVMMKFVLDYMFYQLEKEMRNLKEKWHVLLNFIIVDI